VERANGRSENHRGNVVKPPEDGYRLWLRYDAIDEPSELAARRAQLRGILAPGESATLAAAKNELAKGLGEMLGQVVPFIDEPLRRGTLLAGTPRSCPLVARLGLESELALAGDEGFVLAQTSLEGRPLLVVAANGDLGVLYGAFHLLRRVQTGAPLDRPAAVSRPRIRHRVLDHWDNLDRTVERGYAGFSLWDWHLLPDDLSPRYRDYARANASIGINGAVLTNVNANALVLTGPYLDKVAALAGVFRPYGVRVYLTARFSAPIEIGGLDTADPLDGDVARFWGRKADEIHRVIPDFGGFLVKADSEGQPGPHHYGRTHAEGANMLAAALAPHGGIVMWRAFVYDHNVPDDRAKQAYDTFRPLDGRFAPNVMVQVKNGPIDFQPREPFHPLFGATPNTPLMVEFQVTQEYLGFATHLVYLGTLFKECLDSDTFAAGPGSLVANVVDGTLHRHELTGIAGVANIGTERNWCGHPFAQSNWFAFGRLAWDPALGAEQIAKEWLRLTFTTDPRFVEPAAAMMMGSRDIAVDYMTPLGLHHLMAEHHHYGPGPWVDGGRADWTSVYYHRADADGIGFDRTAHGSGAVTQYAPTLQERWADAEACPEQLLLWFHHVPWDARLSSGRTLWEELCHRYDAGAGGVARMRETWNSLEAFVDVARFEHVASLLRIQEKEARWWRDACLLYFRTFSRRPFPAGIAPPAHTLEHYRRIQHRFVPGSWPGRPIERLPP
jgi:alpha-glucuronidase